jgi:hypothetical protein
MGVRIYNPATGRFLQTEPVPGGSPNAYGFTFFDPINQSDLAGTYSWSWFHVSEISFKTLERFAKGLKIELLFQPFIEDILELIPLPAAEVTGDILDILDPLEEQLEDQLEYLVQFDEPIFLYAAIRVYGTHWWWPHIKIADGYEIESGSNGGGHGHT